MAKRKGRMAEEEWALFTSIYDEGVERYKQDLNLPEDFNDPTIQTLERIRDKLYDRVAPAP
jgi:hypothetical protein